MRASIVSCALLVLACSKESEPGSCYHPNGNTCVEYDGSKAAAGKRLCSGMTWTPGEKSCPTANRLGSCVKQGHSDWMYAGPPNNYSPSSARSVCEWGGGVFTPAPDPTP